MNIIETDVLIIGGGPGGQGSYYQIRNRDPKIKIIWCERGSSSTEIIDTEFLDNIGSGIDKDELLREIRNENDESCNGNPKSVYEPNIFGGGSVLNGMVKFFCDKNDLNDWQGDFSYENISYYYDSITNNGFIGEIPMNSEYCNKIIENIIESPDDIELVDSKTYLSGDSWINKTGLQTSNVMKFDPKSPGKWIGRRMATLKSLIEPMIGIDRMKDENTKIYLNTLAIQIVFKKSETMKRKQVDGVVFLDIKNNQLFFVRVRISVIVGAGVFGSTRLLFNSGIGDFEEMPETVDVSEEHLHLENQPLNNIKIIPTISNKNIGKFKDQVEIKNVVMSGSQPMDEIDPQFRFSNRIAYPILIILYGVLCSIITSVFNLMFFFPWLSSVFRLRVQHVFIFAICEVLMLYLICINFKFFYVGQFLIQPVLLFLCFTFSTYDNSLYFAIEYFFIVNIGLWIASVVHNKFKYYFGINTIYRPLSFVQCFTEKYQMYFIPLAYGIINAFPRVLTDGMRVNFFRRSIRFLLSMFLKLTCFHYAFLDSLVGCLITTRIAKSVGSYNYNRMKRKWILKTNFLVEKDDLDALKVGLYKSRSYLHGLYFIGMYPNILSFINWNQSLESFMKDEMVENFIKKNCSTTYHTVMSLRSGKIKSFTKTDDFNADTLNITEGGFVCDPYDGNRIYGTLNLYAVGSCCFHDITSGSNQGICFVTGMITANKIINKIKT